MRIGKGSQGWPIYIAAAVIITLSYFDARTVTQTFMAMFHQPLVGASVGLLVDRAFFFWRRPSSVEQSHQAEDRRSRMVIGFAIAYALLR